jgi:hypothetical protein
MLRLQRPEQRLLRAENLDRTRGVLRETQKTTGMGDQPRADEFADERGEVGCNRGHAVSEVVVELGAVLRDGDDLVGEEENVGEVGVGDFGSHRNGGRGFEGFFELFREEGREVGSRVVGAEA